MPVGKYTRAVFLAVFIAFLLRTGVGFGRNGFRIGRVLFFFATLNVVYAWFGDDVVGNLYYASRLLFWILGTVATYRLALSGSLVRSSLLNAAYAATIVGAVFTVDLMLRPDTEAGQNASAYTLLWCLPLLLMLKRTVLVYFAVALAALAIVLTVKRGAIVGLVFSFLAYGLTYLWTRTTVRRSLRLVAFLVFIGAVTGYAAAQQWENIKERFSDTSGSGRDELYVLIFERWRHADLENVVFGFGLQSTQRFTGMMFGRKETGVYAHSDWLQYLHDFGLLGVGFLCWLHAEFLLLLRWSYRRRHPYTPALAMAYTILFLVNIYSGHLMAPNAIFLGIIIGFVAAEFRRMLWFGQAHAR